MANCRKQQLNITCGTDVVLYDRLIFDGETFDPNLSVGIAANLVSSLGKRTPLEVEVVDDELLITVPWVEGRFPGCYGLEVTGSCNSKKWSTYADSLIRYTKATVPGESEVTVESDSYDITQEVGYRYAEGGNINDVLVNGDSVVRAGKANITVPTNVSDLHNDANYSTKSYVDTKVEDAIIDTVTVDYTEDGGSPDASVQFINRELNFTMKNMKMKYSEMTAEEKQEIVGPKGTPGDSAIFDPSTGNISTMKQTTGDDDLSPMSQKAVTDTTMDVLQWACAVNELKPYIQRSNNVFRYTSWTAGNIKDDGTIGTSNGWGHSNAFPVCPGMQYIGSGASSMYFALYDINMTFTRRVESKTFTTEAVEVYARITSNVQNANSLWLNEGDTLLERDDFYIKISGDALDLEPFRSSLGLDTLAAIDSNFAYILYKDSASSYSNSGYVTISGQDHAGVDRRCTGYLPYEGGDIIAFGASSNTAYPLMVFFDSEKTCLGYYPDPRTNTLNDKMVIVKEENIPAGTAFVRFNGNAGHTYYNNLVSKTYVDVETATAMVGAETTRATNAEASIKDVIDFMLKKGTNLADLSGRINGKTLDTNGEIADIAQARYACANYIQVKSSTAYTVSRVTILCEYQYDESNGTYVFVKRHNFTTGGTVHTFTTDESTTHIRFAGNQAYATVVQINEGDTLLEYEPYFPGYEATDDFAKVIQGAIEYETSKFFYGPYDIRKSDFQSWYSGLQSDYTLFGVGGSPEYAIPTGAWATKYADVISAYDALMAEDTTYITKKALGTASGTDANDNPYTIYEYVFKPKRYDGAGMNQKVAPKILIDANIHGFERNSAYGLFYFLKDIVENWDKNESLKALRCHVELHVIPISNPYGFDNFTYTNGNSVNINRNFACGNWTVVPVGDKDATGEEPFDQPESAIIRDWILDNADNLMMYINCHTDGRYNADSYANANHWMLSSDRNDDYFNRLYNVGTRHIEEQTLMFPTMYPNVTPSNFFGEINTEATENTSKGTAKQWACTQMNFLSMTLEGFNGLKVGDDQIFRILNDDTQKANSEIIGNTVIQICYEYADS